MKIKVGDDFLDMDNSVIAQTYSVNEIGNLTTRQGGFSNDFTIPLTDRNQAILGIPGDINSASRNPYVKVAATLYDQGAPVAFGNLKYQIVGDKTLQASFFADNTEWFADIKNKTLQDLDLTAFDHDWTAANILDSSLSTPNTSGYIYPLIDYGEFLTDTPVASTVGQMYPAMYLHTLMTQIFFDIGWSITGELTTHPTYKTMILPFSVSDLTHSDTFIAANYQNEIKLIPQLMSGTTPSYVAWDSDEDIDITTGGTYNIRWQIETTLWTGNATVGLFVNDILITSYSDITGDGITSYNRIGIVLASGDVVNIEVDDDPANTLVVQTDGFIELTLEGAIAPGGEIEMNRVVPPMKQTDLVNYIFFAFGIIAQANTFSKTVTLSFFNSIKGNLSNALDWSDKIDLSKSKQFNFTELLNNYKSVSILNYKEDSDSDELKAYEAETGERFGQGQIDIDNEHIAGRDTIYEAPFSPMINILSFTNQIYIPQIKWLDSSGDKQFNPTPKIGIIKLGLDVGLLTGGAQSTMTYGDNASQSTIPFCWFAKTDYTSETDLFDESLAFSQIKFPNANGEPFDQFLVDYEQILNEMKYLKAFLHLTEVDINELDFTLPIYIDFYKSYFYISKIPNYMGSNRTTKLEAVKIG